MLLSSLPLDLEMDISYTRKQFLSLNPKIVLLVKKKKKRLLCEACPLTTVWHPICHLLLTAKLKKKVAITLNHVYQVPFSCMI